MSLAHPSKTSEPDQFGRYEQSPLAAARSRTYDVEGFSQSRGQPKTPGNYGDAQVTTSNLSSQARGAREAQGLVPGRNAQLTTTEHAKRMPSDDVGGPSVQRQASAGATAPIRTTLVAGMLPTPHVVPASVGPYDALSRDPLLGPREMDNKTLLMQRRGRACNTRTDLQKSSMQNVTNNRHYSRGLRAAVPSTTPAHHQRGLQLDPTEGPQARSMSLPVQNNAPIRLKGSGRTAPLKQAKPSVGALLRGAPPASTVSTPADPPFVQVPQAKSRFLAMLLTDTTAGRRAAEVTALNGRRRLRSQRRAEFFARAKSIHGITVNERGQRIAEELSREWALKLEEDDLPADNLSRFTLSNLLSISLQADDITTQPVNVTALNPSSSQLPVHVTGGLPPCSSQSPPPVMSRPASPRPTSVIDYRPDPSRRGANEPLQIFSDGLPTNAHIEHANEPLQIFSGQEAQGQGNRFSAQGQGVQGAQGQGERISGERLSGERISLSLNLAPTTAQVHTNAPTPVVQTCTSCGIRWTCIQSPQRLHDHCTDCASLVPERTVRLSGDPEPLVLPTLTDGPTAAIVGAEQPGTASPPLHAHMSPSGQPFSASPAPFSGPSTPPVFPDGPSTAIAAQTGWPGDAPTAVISASEQPRGAFLSSSAHSSPSEQPYPATSAALPSTGQPPSMAAQQTCFSRHPTADVSPATRQPPRLSTSAAPKDAPVINTASNARRRAVGQQGFGASAQLQMIHTCPAPHSCGIRGAVCGAVTAPGHLCCSTRCHGVYNKQDAQQYSREHPGRCPVLLGKGPTLGVRCGKPCWPTEFFCSRAHCTTHTLNCNGRPCQARITITTVDAATYEVICGRMCAEPTASFPNPSPYCCRFCFFKSTGITSESSSPQWGSSFSTASSTTTRAMIGAVDAAVHNAAQHDRPGAPLASFENDISAGTAQGLADALSAADVYANQMQPQSNATTTPPLQPRAVSDVSRALAASIESKARLDAKRDALARQDRAGMRDASAASIAMHARHEAHKREQDRHRDALFRRQTSIATRRSVAGPLPSAPLVGSAARGGPVYPQRNSSAPRHRPAPAHMTTPVHTSLTHLTAARDANVTRLKLEWSQQLDTATAEALAAEQAALRDDQHQAATRAERRRMANELAATTALRQHTAALAAQAERFRQERSRLTSRVAERALHGAPVVHDTGGTKTVESVQINHLLAEQRKLAEDKQTLLRRNADLMARLQASEQRFPSKGQPSPATNSAGFWPDYDDCARCHTRFPLDSLGSIGICRRCLDFQATRTHDRARGAHVTGRRVQILSDPALPRPPQTVASSAQAPGKANARFPDPFDPTQNRWEGTLESFSTTQRMMTSSAAAYNAQANAKLYAQVQPTHQSHGPPHHAAAARYAPSVTGSDGSDYIKAERVNQSTDHTGSIPVPAGRPRLGYQNLPQASVPADNRTQGLVVHLNTAEPPKHPLLTGHSSLARREFVNAYNEYTDKVLRLQQSSPSTHIPKVPLADCLSREVREELVTYEGLNAEHREGFRRLDGSTVSRRDVEAYLTKWIMQEDAYYTEIDFLLNVKKFETAVKKKSTGSFHMDTPTACVTSLRRWYLRLIKKWQVIRSPKDQIKDLMPFIWPCFIRERLQLEMSSGSEHQRELKKDPMRLLSRWASESKRWFELDPKLWKEGKSVSETYARSAKAQVTDPSEVKRICYSWRDKGTCTFGNGCRFAHDSADSAVDETPSPPASARPCTSWALNQCRYGDTCRFNHDGAGGLLTPGTSKQVCFDWSNGVCRFGDRCRHTHDDESGGSLPIADQIKFKSRHCFAFRAGKCKRGDACEFSHGEAAPRKERKPKTKDAAWFAQKAWPLASSKAWFFEQSDDQQQRLSKMATHSNGWCVRGHQPDKCPICCAAEHNLADCDQANSCERSQCNVFLLRATLTFLETKAIIPGEPPVPTYPLKGKKKKKRTRKKKKAPTESKVALPPSSTSNARRSIEPQLRRDLGAELASRSIPSASFDGRCILNGTDLAYYWDDGASSAMMSDSTVHTIESQGHCSLPRIPLSFPRRMLYADGSKGDVLFQVICDLKIVLHGVVVCNFHECIFDVVTGSATEVCLGRILIEKCGMQSIPTNFAELIAAGKVPKDIFCGDMRAVAAKLTARRCIPRPRVQTPARPCAPPAIHYSDMHNFMHNLDMFEPDVRARSAVSRPTVGHGPPQSPSPAAVVKSAHSRATSVGSAISPEGEGTSAFVTEHSWQHHISIPTILCEHTSRSIVTTAFVDTLPPAAYALDATPQVPVLISDSALAAWTGISRGAAPTGSIMTRVRLLDERATLLLLSDVTLLVVPSDTPAMIVGNDILQRRECLGVDFRTRAALPRTKRPK